MVSGKQPHILSASSNLIGICFVLIAGMKVTNVSDRSIADDICLFAAFAFLGGCILSYLSMRNDRKSQRYELIADYLFLGGLLALFVAVLVFAKGVI